jgi:starch synthase
MYTCMARAWESYRYGDSWRLLQQRGMSSNFSWENSAEKYVQLYRSIPGLENV